METKDCSKKVKDPRTGCSVSFDQVFFQFEENGFVHELRRNHGSIIVFLGKSFSIWKIYIPHLHS